MTARLRVLYFTVVPLHVTSNGGSLCCRNHVARLAADPGIEVFAMTAGPLADKDGTDAFFAGLGITHHFQPFRTDNFRPEVDSIAAIAKFAMQAVLNFPWELQALNQPHVEEGIAWAVRAYGIDVLVIDYHPSAYFLRLPRSDVPTALISLNREGDFYAEQIAAGRTHHGRRTAGPSLWRARRCERRIDAAVDQVIAIGAPDLPRHRVRLPPTCVTPYLDPPARRWAYEGNRTAFFVGNVAHFPNRLAVDWLTRELAPRLLQLGSPVRLVVVGAAETDVPEAQRRHNIDFLGTADAATAAHLFRTADAMICPIANDFGCKFKSLEALAFGIPLLASRATMLGLPQLNGMPCFDLDRPDEAAELVSGVLTDPPRLLDLAREQERRQAAFIASQGDVWSRTLRRLLRSAAQRNAHAQQQAISVAG